MLRLYNAIVLGLLLAAPVAADPMADAPIAADLAKVRSAAAEAGVSDDVQQAWRRLAAVDASRLTELLAGMKDAGPLAENWLRAAIDAVAERRLQSGGALPAADLEAFVNDADQSPRARRTAFEWLATIDPASKPRMLAVMVDDPSMSLRYDAIAQQLESIGTLTEDDTDAKRKQLRRLLPSARDLTQVESIAEQLEELDETVDLPGTLGYLKTWQVIGPFDNTGMEHFDTAYPPESEQVLAKPYAGKKDEVAWGPATAKEDDGFVDFQKPLGNEKEAVAYAYATFVAKESFRDAAVEIRYESKNATKVWLNGELIANNEVYHSGGSFDQYVVAGRLQPGENTLLVKACQNEMKMPWEREWSFRLRVVDGLGTPVAMQPSKAVDAPIKTATPQR